MNCYLQAELGRSNIPGSVTLEIMKKKIIWVKNKYCKTAFYKKKPSRHKTLKMHTGDTDSLNMWE